MRVWKTAVAGSLAAAVMAGGIQQVAAAPLPTNVATMKAAVGDDVTQVHWRGRGFGWGLGGLAAGAIIAGAIASSAPDGNPIAVISNFTPVPRDNYRVPLPKAGNWREIINTDASEYGGSGKGNGGLVEARAEGGSIFATMLLPPLSTIMLELVAD